jgi:hypothetical protein
MIYIKSILVGLGAAILSLALLVTATIMIGERAQPPWNGDVYQAWETSIPVVRILIVCGIVFAFGFTWTFRKSPKRSSPR